jgi:hypothetical protein
MKYNSEELAKFAAQAAELRSKAHKLEEEQKSLNDYGSRDGDRYWLLSIEIKALRAEAAKIYAPVLESMEEDLNNNP